VNTILVRRRLRLTQLKIEQTPVGRKSRTGVALLYVDGVADPALTARLRERIDAIDIDGLISAGYLEQYIADRSTPFPLLENTERPDKFSAQLLAGRVGVLVDGLPLGFLAPATLSRFMRVPEDAAQHYLISSVLAVLRYAALLISLLLPAFYVAVAMYHQEMIPTKLLMSVIGSKQEVPFSTAAEVMGMLVAFELIQEAGLRLPNAVGQTVSIIGALIVGQSAVEARVISPIAVIVVALAGIAGYTVPNQDLSSAVRLFRFLFVLAAIFLGMFGVMAGIVLLVWYLCSLESFGLAYLSPAADRIPGSRISLPARPPLYRQKLRDRALRTPDRRRQR